MRRAFARVGIIAILICAGDAYGADSVVVASRTVSAGALDFPITIRIRSDVEIRGATVPLIIRSVDSGAFVTEVTMSFGERLSSDLLGQLRVTNQYAAQDGVCRADSIPGFSTPVFQGVDQPFTVTASPWGLLFAALAYWPENNLAAGVDSIGSLVLTVDVTTTPGDFEIDTSCVAPYNHLFFVSSTRDLLTPSFQKGTITICDCSHHGDLDGSGAIDGVDLDRLIDWVFFAIGPPPMDSTCPHVDRGDVDCSGTDDSVDVSLMIDIVYFGASVCEPCDCNPYPTSCP